MQLSESYRRICYSYGKACFSQKIFINGLKKGLPLRAWVEETVYRVETCWLSVKKEVPGAVGSKEVILTIFWDIKGPFTIDFLETGETINSASCC